MIEQLRKFATLTIGVLIIQLLLLRNFDIGLWGYHYIHFYIYPIIFLLASNKIPRTLLVFLGFVIGVFIDLFYDSLGIHAAASTLTCYLRHYILNILEPTEGYKFDSFRPYRLGWPWFASYVCILLLIHILVYYSIEAFSLVYIQEIILRTIFSFLASYFVIIISVLIFNPKK